MTNMTGCQLPSVPKLSEGPVQFEQKHLLRRIKLTLAAPWNYQVKPWLKQAYRIYVDRFGAHKPRQPELSIRADSPIPVGNLAPHPLEQYSRVGGATPKESDRLSAGDWVRIRPDQEIRAMLDPFKETRGCAFLDEMYQYCGTKQRILKSMERFLDERDYKVKKVRGIFLLENVICNGTPTFGKCDRCCYLFWRGEWLEKIAE